MPTQTQTLAYFGKLPAHGDFVRRNAGGPAFKALEEWIRSGLGMLAGRDRRAARETAAPLSFYFDPGGAAQGLVGVIHPSRDRVGRAFPLVLAFERERETLQGLVRVPPAFNVFFEQALHLGREAAAGRLTPPRLAARAATFDVFPSGRAAPALARYLNQTTLGAFWQRLWGRPGDARKYLLFKNLLDILLPLREGVPPGFSLVLRFPLATEAEARSFEVSFWIDACLRLLDAPATLHPTFFWTATEPPGTAAFLWLALQPPSARFFAYVTDPDREDDTLCILEGREERHAPAVAPVLPNPYGRLLDDDLSLQDVLDRL